jgi:hypothetical protein
MPKRDTAPVVSSIGDKLEADIGQLDIDIERCFKSIHINLRKNNAQLESLIQMFNVENKGAQDVKKTLESVERLCQQSLTKTKQLEHKIKNRDNRLQKRMNMVKAKIVCEMYNAQQTNFTWGKPTLLVKPSDTEIAAEQELLKDTSVDMLKMDRE